jgi:hypothetical protein
LTPPEGTVGTRFDWIAEQIAGALATQCDPETGFADTEFYGSAFATMLWQRWPERFNADIKAALDRLKRQDKQARIGVWENRFHWEFVRFALADLFRSGPVGHYREPGDVLGGMGFIRSRVANWTLLRSTVRLAGTARLDRIIGRMERWLALAIYQRPDGFIEDQRGAPTQQYHAFATALLGYQISVLEEPSAALHEKFRAALQALVRTALHDGEVNAIGRGRFQSFGYAAAALALAIGLRLGCAPEGSITLLRAIADRLEAALGPGGTLPLMITRIDETEEVTPPPHHPHQRRIGWHSYNNGPDYLAFSGAVLKLAAEQLAASPEPGTPCRFRRRTVWRTVSGSSATPPIPRSPPCHAVASPRPSPCPISSRPAARDLCRPMATRPCRTVSILPCPCLCRSSRSMTARSAPCFPALISAGPGRIKSSVRPLRSASSGVSVSRPGQSRLRMP